LRFEVEVNDVLHLAACALKSEGALDAISIRLILDFVCFELGVVGVRMTNPKRRQAARTPQPGGIFGAPSTLGANFVLGIAVVCRFAAD
jgi:hypothetical protein